MTLVRTGDGLTDQLVDSEGKVVATFDTKEFRLEPRLSRALLRAHAASFGHHAVESQRGSFNSVRKIERALVDLGLHETLPLPRTCFAQVHRWLALAGLKGCTARKIQNEISTVFQWCARNVQGIFVAKASFAAPMFPLDPPVPLRRHSEADTKAVLLACYGEIEAVEARLARGKLLLEGTCASAEDRALSAYLAELLQMGGGFLPDGTLFDTKAQRSQFRELGGLRGVGKLIYLWHDDVFPFYLAVTVQSGGNPRAIRAASKKNVITPHPLRDDLEALNWDKPRAGREQRIDFPVGREWSAPNIIRRLLALNEGLREQCSPSDRDKVFIGLDVRARSAGLAHTSTFQNNVAAFIKRHRLPTFSLKDWRSSAARAHHVVSGSIDTARKRLNHRLPSTTGRYSGPEDVAVANDQAILKFQGELVHGRPAAPGTGPHSDVGAEHEAPADTVFGFGCKSPTAGLDGETPTGVRCANFTRCSGCKGSLFVVDDPVVVARVLGARDALQRARKRSLAEGWWPRFKALYENTLVAITTELLPAVSNTVLELAKPHVKPHHIPELE